jgi:ubiquinone/menaquinone biosynthesis C-methylase UbiE
MTIYRAENLIEAYRARAKSDDINDLSGRTGSPHLTKSIAQHIVQELGLNKDDKLVDIGCGDGSLLLMAAESGVDPWLGRLVGVLPTEEEVRRVQEHLLKYKLAEGGVQVTKGLSQSTLLPDAFATKVVSNGVFLLLDDESQVNRSLIEMHRITKSGGVIFIGELPDADETVASGTLTAKSSLPFRIFNVLMRNGILEIMRRLMNRISATFSKKLIIISPKAPFWMKPTEFTEKLENFGFKVVKHYSCEEALNSKNSGSSESRVLRWNYIAVRK